LDHVPIHRKIETAIFQDQHILDQYHTFESPIDKLVSSHFHEIELNQKCGSDPKFCDPV